MREREMRRRLHKLEQLPQPQPPPTPFEQIEKLAIKQMSNEDLKLLTKAFLDGEAGVRRTLLPNELAALERKDAAQETEARRMGFRSVADAEGRARQRR
jgi:hypothetical protein